METQDTLRELLAAIVLVSVKNLQDIKPISGNLFLNPTARNTLMCLSIGTHKNNKFSIC